MTAALLGLIVLNGCGGSEPPTAVSSPTPTPTAATPVPTATPNPFAAACGSPLPNLSDLYGFGIKVQLEPSIRRKILNSSPYVKNATYCQSVGLGGQFCETRFETDPHRVACDNYVSGISDEKGGPGPTWYQEINGKRLRCPGLTGSPGDAPDCRLKDNQYLLDVFGPGTYLACAGAGSNGSCGICVLAPETYDTPPEIIESGTRRPGLCQ
jgi:hypothetical protein